MLSKENMQLGNLVWFGMWKHGPNVSEASWVLRKLGPKQFPAVAAMPQNTCTVFWGVHSGGHETR